MFVLGCTRSNAGLQMIFSLCFGGRHYFQTSAILKLWVESMAKDTRNKHEYSDYHRNMVILFSQFFNLLVLGLFNYHSGSPAALPTPPPCCRPIENIGRQAGSNAQFLLNRNIGRQFVLRCNDSRCWCPSVGTPPLIWNTFDQYKSTTVNLCRQLFTGRVAPKRKAIKNALALL